MLFLENVLLIDSLVCVETEFKRNFMPFGIFTGPRRPNLFLMWPTSRKELPTSALDGTTNATNQLLFSAAFHRYPLCSLSILYSYVFSRDYYYLCRTKQQKSLL